MNMQCFYNDAITEQTRPDTVLKTVGHGHIDTETATLATRPDTVFNTVWKRSDTANIGGETAALATRLDTELKTVR